jgi:hypothetical protein
MEDYLHHIENSNLSDIDDTCKNAVIDSLESGKIIYLPNYYINHVDNYSSLLTDSILAKNSKNISYFILNNKLSGFNVLSNQHDMLLNFMKEYAVFAHNLASSLFPQYSQNLVWGRTSYRPAQIDGRATSKRKDDTKIHVDAFPATPVNGFRIFRVFCNINPYHKPRVWNVGEPFADLLGKFSHTIPKYSELNAKILNTLKITKSKRTRYDHYMLNLHDNMKLDDKYQTNLEKFQFNFPAYSTWMVFTDQVSHAALSGQFLLEQTFYLPMDKMRNPNLSPLKQLERAGLKITP